MKILNHQTLILLSLVAGTLTSCNGFISTPVVPSPDATETAIIATPPPSPLAPTITSVPASDRIIYYFFVTIAEGAPPERSVVIMPDTYILAPALSNITYGPDTAVDLKAALEAVLNDERNGWISSNLDIIEVVFDEGRADVVLQGEYFGVGDVTLIAARMQILMTLFANTSVQTATVTLNGDTIANMGVSREAKPANYVYTRAEVETFMAEHAYVTP